MYVRPNIYLKISLLKQTTLVRITTYGYWVVAFLFTFTEQRSLTQPETQTLKIPTLKIVENSIKTIIAVQFLRQMQNILVPIYMSDKVLLMLILLCSVFVVGCPAYLVADKLAHKLGFTVRFVDSYVEELLTLIIQSELGHCALIHLLRGHGPLHASGSIKDYR